MVHPGFCYIWIEISLIVRFDISNILLLPIRSRNNSEGMYKWVYLTQYWFVVMGDGVMAAIEYV